MRIPTALGLVILAAAAGVRAQEHADHVMPKQTLFTVRAVPEEVVKRTATATKASATGAFVIAPDAKLVSYRVTWNALRGSAARVDLHNFGRGREGKVVQELCGRRTRPCPAGRGATIEGNWEIPPKLVQEFASERIYLDIHTSAAPD